MGWIRRGMMVVLLGPSLMSGQALKLVPKDPAPEQIGQNPPVDREIVDADFSRLTVKQRPPSLVYPPLAKIAGIQGDVVVQFTLDPSGRPETVRAVEGPNQLLGGAMRYAAQWEFEPLRKNGRPIHARARMTIQFRLRGSSPALPFKDAHKARIRMDVLPATANLPGVDPKGIEKAVRSWFERHNIQTIDSPQDSDPDTLVLKLKLQTLAAPDGRKVLGLSGESFRKSSVHANNPEIASTRPAWRGQWIGGKRGEGSFDSQVDRAVQSLLYDLARLPLPAPRDPNRFSLEPASSDLEEVSNGPDNPVQLVSDQIKAKHSTILEKMENQEAVLVDLILDPSGRPIQATAIQGPPEQMFSAVATALTWEFEPYSEKGTPKYARFRIRVPDTSNGAKTTTPLP